MRFSTTGPQGGVTAPPAPPPPVHITEGVYFTLYNLSACIKVTFVSAEHRPTSPVDQCLSSH